MVVCWRSTCISQPSLCSYIIESYEVEYNFFAMQCCRAIICLLSFIFQPPAIRYFYSALVLHTLHPYSHYFVFLQGYFRPCLDRSRKDKREVAPAWYALSQTRFKTLKGVVSADGDGERSSGVDDLARHEPPSQVLALTSRCHMWLHEIGRASCRERV